MKKNLLLMCALFVALTTFGQKESQTLKCGNAPQVKSTTSDWAEVVDFTATDINGVQHHLQTYLDAGKYVIVDASATWCGPCWSLHQTGVFDELHEHSINKALAKSPNKQQVLREIKYKIP